MNKNRTIKYWYKQVGGRCAEYSRIMLLSYFLNKSFIPEEVFQLIKEKNKTIYRLLADGDLGVFVKETKTRKDKPQELIDAIARNPILAQITIYKDINYNMRNIGFCYTEFKPKPPAHQIMVLDYNADSGKVAVANTWGKNVIQWIDFAFFFLSMRSYTEWTILEKPPYNKANPNSMPLPLRQVTALNQRSQLYNQKLGNTKYTIRSWGCLTVSLCMALERLRGTPASPNNAAKCWKYDKLGYLLWANTKFKGAKFMGVHLYSYSKIQEYSTNDKACIIQVKNNKIPMHFVFVDKIEGKEVYIIDPMGGKRTTMRESGYYLPVSLRLLEANTEIIK